MKVILPFEAGLHTPLAQLQAIMHGHTTRTDQQLFTDCHAATCAEMCTA